MKNKLILLCLLGLIISLSSCFVREHDHHEHHDHDRDHGRHEEHHEEHRDIR